MRLPGRPSRYAWAAAIVLTCSLIGLLVERHLEAVNIAMFYLLGVLVVAEHAVRLVVDPVPVPGDQLLLEVTMLRRRARFRYFRSIAMALRFASRWPSG